MVWFQTSKYWPCKITKFGPFMNFMFFFQQDIHSCIGLRGDGTLFGYTQLQGSLNSQKYHTLLQHRVQSVLRGGGLRNFVFRENQLTGALAGVELSRDQPAAEVDQVILTHFWPKNGQKWPKITFVTVRLTGGPKLVDQTWSRFDLARTHLGRCVWAFSRVRAGPGGPP